MFRKFVMFSGFAAGFTTFGAFASELAGEDFTGERRISAARITAPADRPELLLAQAGDVEIYYDVYGRRVIVDSWSGEVLAVQPRRESRRPLRERPRRNQGYYLDNPDDMERLRRDQRNEFGRAVPPIDEYPADSRGVFPDAPPAPEAEYPSPDYPSAEYPGEAFPEAPGDDFMEPELPRTARREPVERAPLGEVGPAPQEPGEIIVEPENPVAIEPPASSAARIEVAELQILLDRKGASPGVIDGHFGSNVDKGLAAYRQLTGEMLRSTDAVGIKQALADSGGDAFIDYTITATDAAGPYVASVPADYGEKAKLERLSYTSVPEMLAERFHMDERYLKALNPGANFGRPGTIIRVANIGAPVKEPVARIVADKGQKQVRAYDAAGALVAAYPATIGSSDTPSPTGTHTVARVAIDPVYTYNPKINFKQGDNHSVLTIPPGPNGPVGSVWIALSKPTYGIHGTPDPSKIGKTESHGCVRLTNWDAQELARIVKPGVTVEFME